MMDDFASETMQGKSKTEVINLKYWEKNVNLEFFTGEKILQKQL